MGKKSSQREQRRRAAQRQSRRKRWLIWSSVGVVLVVAGIFAFTRDLPEALAEVESFPPTGRGHLTAGESPPEYNSSPATSGDHSSVPAECGIYTSEIPDAVQIHNLEHGAVVIQYRPDLDPVEIESIRGFARSKPSHILVAPRSDLSDPVVVTSWTRMLRLETADIETIDLYYEQFSFTGPEAGVPCAFAIDESL